MGATMNNCVNPRFQRGFTLVEVLVGMAVALIGMVMMFQSMQVWDARKRTTAGGSDAQVAGSILNAISKWQVTASAMQRE